MYIGHISLILFIIIFLLGLYLYSNDVDDYDF